MNCKTNLYIEFLYPSYEFDKYHCSVKKAEKIDLALKLEDMPERTVGFRYYVYLTATVNFNKRRETLRSRKIYLTSAFFFKAQKFSIDQYRSMTENKDKQSELIDAINSSQTKTAIRFHNGKWGILQPTDVLL